MFSKIIFNKLITAVIGSLMILLISAAAIPIVAQGLQVPPSANWPMDGGPMATLTGEVTLGKLIPNGNAIVAITKLEWHREGIRQIAAVPTSNVAFGPFKLKLSALTNDSRTVRGNYRISIQARSPALLEPTTGFVEIGHIYHDLIVETSPYDLQSVEANVWVKGTLPGVFTAIQLVASVVVSGGAYDSTISYFPSQKCSDLTAEGRTDRDCLQAAINPLMLVTPKVVPISIIYEPPGDCSWVKLINSHTAGAGITVEESNSTSTRTLRDVSVLGFQIEGEDVETKKDYEDNRVSRVTLRDMGTNGTLLSIPNTSCVDAFKLLPFAKDTDKRGPGKGDVFILLPNPPMVYWDTEEMTNFKFLRSEVLKGQSSEPFQISAWQLQKNEGLPPGISLTCQERAAILALDPFFTGTVCPGPEPPSDIEHKQLPGKFGPFRGLPKGRFIEFKPIPLSQYHYNDQVKSKEWATAKAIKERIVEIDRESSTQNNLAVKLISAAIAKGAEKATIAVAKKFTGFAAEAWGSDKSKGDFKEMEKSIDKISLSEWTPLKDETTTTTTITYSRNKIIESSKEDDFTQHWFVQNTQRGMCVGVYYDTFFGTFAFHELPACMGVSKITVNLPNFVRPAEIKSGEALDQALPVELAERLKAVGSSLEQGSISFEAVQPDKYDVPEGFVKGLPTGMQFDLAEGKLSGTATVTIGTTFQSLFYVKNAQGEKAAELWVTVQVFAPPVLEGAIDLVNCQTVSGLARDKNNPTSIVKVDIFDGNRLLATVMANQLWKDTLSFDPGAGNQLPGRGDNYHGFSYPIPDSLKDGRPHLITVRFAVTGTSLAGSPKTISINPPPVITNQPDDLSICTGKPATFSVTATGVGLQYQWYKDNAPIAGATGRSFNIAAVGAGDFGVYSVVISTGCSSVTSRSATLSGNDAVAITSQPMSAGACVGQPVTFSVSATGANLRYQWRKNGGNIPGATGSSFSIPSLSLDDAGSYSVVVYNGCSAVNSATAVLTINNAIAITSHPVSVTKCAGQPVTFSATATGSNLRYLWRKNGGNISGAESSSYTIPSVSAGDAGSYSVVVYNGCSMMSSATATLTVNAAMTLSPSSLITDSSAGNSRVVIRGSCSWTADSNVPWITITGPTSGAGNGLITYSVARNTGPARTGTMTIAGQTFTVTQQAGANADRNDARFVPPQTVPVSLTPGQRFDVSIRMKNTGQTTWTVADGYRLVSQAPVNNNTWGLREVALPSAVAPGAEVSFNFTITAPAAPGTYRFEWAMMQGLFAFGSFSPAIEITVR